MVRVLILLAVIVPVLPALAADDPVQPVNADAGGVAVKGYDAVAYFAEGKAVHGSSAYEYQWAGATWRFATAANRDRFAANPEAYAPQFGGYCAWAVSRNYTADIDPEAFEIVDGKLYLNYSKLVQLRWRVNREDNIRRGERNWPKLSAPAKGTK